MNKQIKEKKYYDTKDIKLKTLTQQYLLLSKEYDNTIYSLRLLMEEKDDYVQPLKAELLFKLSLLIERYKKSKIDNYTIFIEDLEQLKVKIIGM